MFLYSDPPQHPLRRVRHLQTLQLDTLDLQPYIDKQRLRPHHFEGVDLKKYILIGCQL